MINLRNIILIILVTMIFGTPMGFLAGVPFSWSSAAIAALAFVILGLLPSYFSAKRR